MKLYKTIPLILILSILLTGCKTKEVIKIEDPLKPVTIVDIETKTYSKDIEMSGNVKPAQLVKIGFKVSGVIEEAYVKEGDDISAGQTLMHINPHDYELGVIAANAKYESLDMELRSKIDSAINQAKANLDFVNIQLERVRRLHEKGAVAKKTVEELEVALVVAENKHQEATDAKATSESQLRQAEAGLELAQSQLSDTVLTSPIDGTVVKQVFEAGETIAPGHPALVLGRLDTLEVEVGVPDNLIDLIKIGEEVNIFIYGIDKQIKGVISSIDTTADLETRTFGVKIDIDNAERHIKPGMIANVTINMDKVSAITVPIDSVLDNGEGSSVFIYDKETSSVIRREIKTGNVFGDRIEITEGLENGETIVVDGQYRLIDGEKVNARRVEEND